MTLNEIGVQAKTASRMLQKMGQKEKNALLECAAGLLVENIPKLIEANDKDIANARQKGIKDALIDRLKLTPARIRSMASGLTEIAALHDPVGEIVESAVRPNGLEICKKEFPSVSLVSFTNPVPMLPQTPSVCVLKQEMPLF